MSTTKTINTATVTLTTVEVKDGKSEENTIITTILSCDPLSNAKIFNEVHRIYPTAVIISVDQYAIDINDFVMIARVEQ